MKNLTRDLKLFVSRLDGKKINFVLFLLTLTLFVIGAGAPDHGGVIIR
jgi:hypothetical protein